jgi:hypothetical protein
VSCSFSRQTLSLFTLLATCIGLFGDSLAMAHSPRDDRSKEFGWLASYSQGKALAKKTGKPMMVVFRCVP